MLTKEQMDEFEKLAKPLMKWISDNMNPHAMIIIDSMTAEVVVGECAITTDEFVKD